MALTNLTERVNQKTVEERYCSAEFTQGIHGELIFLSVVNICLSISAVLGNTLILVALNKETSLHQASKLLYSTLAITDLGVAIIVEPLAVTYWTSVVNEKWNICYYTHFARDISAYALSSVSFFTLTAISFDRLLALTLGLRYRQVVTLKRTLTSVLVSWFFSSIVASSNSDNFMVCQSRFRSRYSHNSFLLYKNFLHTSSKPNSCSTERRFSRASNSSNSTERSAIQKGSVQCTVGAASVGHLLSAE